MKNVIMRTCTGLLYIGAIVGALCLGGWCLWALVLLLGLLGVSEFNRISNNNFVSNTTTFLDFAGVFFVVTIFMDNANISFAYKNELQLACLIGYFLYVLLRLVSQLYVHDGNPLSHLAHSLMAQIYVVIPLGLLEVFYSLAGMQMALCMFVLIWLNDTGAYCSGMLFGRHKLFERISPKKTWEGFFGGMIFCVAASVCMSMLISPDVYSFTIRQSVAWGILVCVFGTWGDLIESMIKRSIGVKDSGNILPGHGGILDRIDSLLLVAPATLLYWGILYFM